MKRLTTVLILMFFMLLSVDLMAGIGVGVSAPAALPVQLTLFSASRLSNGIKLVWNTATEINNYGFDIERRRETGFGKLQLGAWTKIGFVQGHGNSNSPKSYTYLDMLASETNQYRLKQIDFNGSFEFSNVVTAEAGVPVDYSLKQNYPNPFNPTTTISYEIPLPGKVILKVYNSIGQEISTLVNEFKNAGPHQVVFSLLGSTLPSGIYFYQLRSGGYSEIKKMSVMK